LLIWLDDERRAVDVPEDFVNRGTFAVMARPDFNPVSFISESADLPAELPQTIHYWRSYPRRYELVVAEDVTLKRGEPASGPGATKIPMADALVFERVSGKGRVCL
jgi:hypothetical protein